MSKSMIFEGKTTNEAIEKGLKELHVSKDKVEIIVIEEDKRSFFSILEPRKVKVEMTIKENKEENNIVKETKEKVIEEVSAEEIEKMQKEVSKFLEELISKLPSNDIKFEVGQQDNYITVDIDGDDVNYLIGYRGETLNSIQVLLSAFVSNKTKSKIRVIVDIANYKNKRKKTLEDLAVKTANRVIRTKKQVTLEPMHPYDRKIIHTKLQDNNKVKTYSVGEEPHRKIVIAPM